MSFIRVPLIFFSLMFLIEVYGSPQPGGSYHHVLHRIHVPQKIKTIYHTKIIKVPEHHHHFHEKEKIIIEKEKPKEEHHHPIILKEDHHSDWSGLDSGVDGDGFYKKKRNAKLSDEEEDDKIERSQERRVKKKRVSIPHSRPFTYYRPK